MRNLPLETLLQNIPSAARFFAKLKKLRIITVRDLLWHFPTRYEDFSRISKIADLIPRKEATIQGEIKEIGGRRTWRRRLYLVEALITDDTGSIRAVWFNQPYVKNVLRIGRMANFSGKVSISEENELYLSNPTHELISARSLQPTTYNLQPTKHTARIVPIYPETRGLTSKGLRYMIKPLLDNLKKITEIFPTETLKKENLPEVNKALQNIHFPEKIDDALAAKRRFAFEDLFFLQLFNIKNRLALTKKKAAPIEIDLDYVKDLLNHLPFALTLSQKKSLWEILQNLAKNQPMNRLLQGDVGSGKTIVAAIAALAAAHKGLQTAFMTPTEILARQHYQTIMKFFPGFEGGLALLTSSEAKVFYGHGLESSPPAGGKKPALIKEITEGKIKIIIGTHALIQKNVLFPKLALVIVDEQHRFGVRQRATLLKDKNIVPHFLSMSATPIPRTLSLTIFGDLDLSLINELPKDRKPIATKIIAPENRKKAYEFIRSEIGKGRQAFVICPRIEPTDKNIPVNETEIKKLELKSVKEEYEKLSKKVFPELRVAMLHGKLKSDEKKKTMTGFLKNELNILVATSVVEVGVDIPNATIMMIESAERFGLAQLYQFRGRVGRGKHQSYCFLFTESSAKSTQGRLKAVVEAKNGFELAERDLKLRGPGEFLGEIQTGMPDIAMKALQNPDLVKTAREAALEIIKKDPTLKNHFLVAEKLNQFQTQIHQE